MVVEHQHVHAAFAEPGDLRDGGRAAVHGEQQLHRKFLQTILHAGLTETVALVHAVRQIAMHFPAQRGQHVMQQGGGGHTVHVVITEDDQRLARGVRREQPLDGDAHVRKQKRIGKVLQLWIEKARDGFRLAVTAIEQALCEERGDF